MKKSLLDIFFFFFLKKEEEEEETYGSSGGCAWRDRYLGEILVSQVPGPELLRKDISFISCISHISHI